MQTIKVNFDTFLYFVLVLGFFDTVTRFPFSEALSPFRLLAIFALLYVCIRDFKKIKCIIFFMIGIALYSIAMILIWEGNIQIFISHYIHWIFVFSILTSIIHLMRGKNFENDFFRFLDVMTIIVTAFFFFEYFTGKRFFAEKIAEYSVPSSFFYGINDYASAIMGMGVLYAAKLVHDKKLIYLFKFCLVFISVTLVGARASMVILAASIALAFLLCLSKRIEPSFYKRVILIVLIGILGVVLLFVVNPTVGDATVTELLLEPVSQIIRLEVSSFEGSITVRTSAMVLGLKSIIRTFGFGIGIGNATYMLTNYGFQVLKSMHNMVMQLWVELGWVFIVGCYIIIKKVIKSYKKNGRKIDTYGLIFVILTPLFAVQSSEGLMSIYPFWMIYFYVLSLVVIK